MAAGAACALLFALPAISQELRGPLDEAGTADTGIPAPAYQPGALSEEEEDEALFPDTTGDPLSDPSAPGQPEEVREPETAETELDPLTTGNTRATTVDAEQEFETPRRMNERVTAIEGRPPQREENPYAPLGLRVGKFTVVPTLEQGLTWTSNADDIPDGEDAILSETTLRLNAVSDWSRHRAALNGFGTFRRSITGDEVRELEGGADAMLELDLAHEYLARATLRYDIGREGASSPNIIAGVDEQPLRHTIDGSVGLEKALGKARFGITGEVSRNQYGDAELSGDGTLSQADRNSTLALLRLRGGYQVSPALMPFVELEAGHRFYDEDFDGFGYARSATRLGARAGLSLDLSEKLAGEVSAGWISENFEDDRLETISGLALAASLEWSPMRGTIVGFDAATRIEGTTNAGESGSLLYDGTLRIERALRSNLTGNLAFGASYRDYAAGGHDLVLSGEAALTWWLNRYVGLIGRARHERQTSSLPGRDYETTSIFMGMKLQR